jgi:PTS system fructose-specific IIA component
VNKLDIITGSNIILLDVDCKSKEEIIKVLSNKLKEDNRIKDVESYFNEVIKREAVYSTSVGFEIAIPHGKCDSVNKTSVAFARLKEKLLWEDEEEVKIVFLLAVPSKEAGDKHLELLASISRRLMHEEYRDKLNSAASSQDIVDLIQNN